MTEFTAGEKYAAARRELAKRRQVYPRLIDRGQMSRAQADHEIKIMEAIMEDYKQASEGERLL